MELAKILPDGTIDLRYCDPKIGSRVTELRNAGFLDFVASEQHNAMPGISQRIHSQSLVERWFSLGKPRLTPKPSKHKLAN